MQVKSIAECSKRILSTFIKLPFVIKIFVLFIFEWLFYTSFTARKTCVKPTLSKRPQIGFQDQLSLNAGQKYCRMIQGEHSAILSTFIKLPFVIKILFCLFLSGCFTCFYSKTCVKQPLSKRPKIGFLDDRKLVFSTDQLSLNAGQKYCRMLQGEHSAILSTCIKLPFVIGIFVLSIFE